MIDIPGIQPPGSRAGSVVGPMRLSNFIRANSRSIITEWEAFARTLLSPPIGELLLRDDIEEILTAIASDMREGQTSAEQEKKGKGDKEVGGVEGALDEAARHHAQQRIDVGLDIEQAASELRALRASIVRLWEKARPVPDERVIDELIRFNEAVDQILVGSVRASVERVSRYRDRFLAILGHDLRTPLGAIAMSAEVINRAEDIDLRYGRAATRILNSARRMEEMVGDLLDLTRAHLGSVFPIERGPADLEAVCRVVLDEVEAFHPERVLRFESSGDLHGEWDGERLEQVISNLVANAVQHGDPTAPIVVSAWAEGDEVACAVHNEGPAIPEEDLGKVFEPLTRSRNAETKTVPEGLGLGLFIAREIARAHGGGVSLTSSADQGTTFTVRLPRGPLPAAGSV